MNTKEFIDEAVSLPIEKRVLIVDSLLQSLNQPESEIDKKWNEIAQKRLTEVRSSQSQASKFLKKFGKSLKDEF